MHYLPPGGRDQDSPIIFAWLSWCISQWKLGKGDVRVEVLLHTVTNICNKMGSSKTTCPKYGIYSSSNIFASTLWPMAKS
jgi:hypothetical protein